MESTYHPTTFKSLESWLHNQEKTLNSIGEFETGIRYNFQQPERVFVPSGGELAKRVLESWGKGLVHRLFQSPDRYLNGKSYHHTLDAIAQVFREIKDHLYPYQLKLNQNTQKAVWVSVNSLNDFKRSFYAALGGVEKIKVTYVQDQNNRHPTDLQARAVQIGHYFVRIHHWIEETQKLLTQIEAQSKEIESSGSDYCPAFYSDEWIESIEFSYVVIPQENWFKVLRLDNELNCDEWLKIYRFIHQHRTDWEEAFSDNKDHSIYLNKKKTGLLRTLEVFYDDVIVETKGRMIGQGVVKKVSLAVSLTRGCYVAHASSYLKVNSSSRHLLGDREILPKVANKEKELLLSYKKVPGIAQAYHIIEYEPFEGVIKQGIWMKFYREGNLREVMQRHHLSPQQKIDIAINVASGISRLHRDDWVHRDIKPDNIFVDKIEMGKTVVAVLGDLGSAKRLPIKNGGSPAYFAPEIWAYYNFFEPPYGHQLGPQVDAWAYGCVLYELFYEKLPPWIAVLANTKYPSRGSAEAREILDLMCASTKSQKPKNPYTIDYVIWVLLRPNPFLRTTVESACIRLSEIKLKN